MKRSKIRLIDEETLKKSIEKWLNPDPNADRMVDIDDIAVSVMMEIEEQPTAYDVDKVVAELEKEKKKHKRLIEYKKKNGTTTEESEQRKSVEVLDRAIQIVKGGGVDGYFKGSYISLSYGKYKSICR